MMLRKYFQEVAIFLPIMAIVFFGFAWLSRHLSWLQMGLLIALGLAVAIPVLVLLIRRAMKDAERRRAEFARLAAELGLSFSAEETGRLRERFADLPIFGRHSVSRASCVMEGTRCGHGLTACHYTYGEVTDNKGNERTESISTAVATLDCRLPHLLIRPEGLLDKAAAAAGLEDVDFESHEFSRRFHVKSAERRFAYQVLTPQTMELLLAHPEWNIEMAGRDVMIWQRRAWEAAQFREAIGVLEGFLDCVPRFVWKELGEQQEAAKSG